MADNPTTLIYRDHRISLNHEFTFNVSGPMINAENHSGSNVYPSIAVAKEKIDQLLKIKGVKDKRKLHLRVLVDGNKEVSQHIVHGIHSVSGHTLGVPETGAYNSPDLYPVVQWIEDLLHEKHRLQQRLEEIRKAIHPFEINSSRGYRSGKTAEVYENQLRELEKEHADATKEATETNDRMLVKYSA